ncbi:MAG TPA: hypothetical protein VK447_07050 [Myxococcaceae bacterium]|nr:hypothetical protein [Myxococcaceae bacterium]
MTTESRAQRSRWELLERELGDLEQLSAPEPGRRVGVGPPRQAASVFAELSKRYGELLELSLERRVYKNVTAEPSQGLRSLGERLGALRAGPSAWWTCAPGCWGPRRAALRLRRRRLMSPREGCWCWS